MLAWLLGEPTGDTVRQAFVRADLVITSELTLVECDRALIRGQTIGELPDVDARRLRRSLVETAEHWNVMRIQREIVERARSPFPGEPVRTLDALHLASALVARSAVEDLAILSLDERVRVAGRALGLRVLPV